MAENLPEFNNFDDKLLGEDAFDKAFAAEMKQQEVSANVFRLRLKVLHKMMDEALICAGITDMRLAYTREVTDVLQELLLIIKDPDSPQTDVMLAAQVSALVTWRLTRAAVVAAQRQLDPASTESPDDPLEI